MNAYIIEGFKLEDHLRDCEIVSEVFKDLDGYITLKHKKLKLGEELSLYLYDSGQATFEYRDREVETFMWNEDAAELFEHFYSLRITDLFEFMYQRRWIGAMEVE
ncbi:hypothetical protein SPD48_14505 [Pseudogracilibacillus sp. SE30717A]|uniref:hypothetical protein n=1 Tax=Pseudogracilibacillus sp. SE30717A TaxID=3098293 RepID=UPI00300E355B